MCVRKMGHGTEGKGNWGVCCERGGETLGIVRQATCSRGGDDLMGHLVREGVYIGSYILEGDTYTSIEIK